MYFPIRKTRLIWIALIAGLCLFPLTYAFSEPTTNLTEQEKRDVLMLRMEEKVDDFMKEYEGRIKNPEDVRKQRRELEAQMEVFLDNLEKHAKDPAAAQKEMDQWLEARRQEAEARAEETTGLKIFQTKVFFGGWSIFFAVVIGAFLLKYAYNIVRDSAGATKNFIWDLTGKSRTTAGEHLLGPLSTAGGPKPNYGGARSGGSQRKSSRPAKKRFQFGEVLVQFVNPFVDRDLIEEIAARQKTEQSRLRLGEMLKKQEIITQDELDETLAKQKFYRRPK